MAIAEKKKVQTFINLTAAAVDDLKTVATSLEALRARYVAEAVDPTGTPLDGHVAEVSTWIDAVRAVADDVVPNAFLAHVVPTHANNALGEL